MSVLFRDHATVTENAPAGVACRAHVPLDEAIDAAATAGELLAFLGGMRTGSLVELPATVALGPLGCRRCMLAADASPAAREFLSVRPLGPDEGDWGYALTAGPGSDAVARCRSGETALPDPAAAFDEAVERLLGGTLIP